MTVINWVINYVVKELLALPSRIIVLVFCVTILLLPVFVDNVYWLRIIALASIFAIYAASWDLLVGFVGQVSFGHAIFFGVAAYSTAILNLRFGLENWMTIPLGALIAVLLGLIIGIPSLRLRGPYLGLATIAFPIMLMGILFMFPEYTGGELGISGLDRLAGARVKEYYIAVTAMIVLCFAIWKISDSKIGIIFHAIREDEIAVRASGINTVRYKLLAFYLSGFFAGIAGGLYAHFLRIAGPATLDMMMSFLPIIWTIFGGIATIYGAVAGVFILYPALELLRAIPEYRLLLFAVIVLLVLRFMPEGIATWVREKLEWECPRCKVRNAFTRKDCRICATTNIIN